MDILHPLAVKLSQGFLSSKTGACSGSISVLAGNDINVKANEFHFGEF